MHQYNKYKSKNSIFIQTLFGGAVPNESTELQLQLSQDVFKCFPRKKFDFSKFDGELEDVQFLPNNDVLIIISKEQGQEKLFKFSKVGDNAISSGSYGDVFLYKNEAEEHIVIKRAKEGRNLQDDQRALKLMGEKCNNLYIRGKFKEKFGFVNPTETDDDFSKRTAKEKKIYAGIVLLEALDGNLSDFINKITEEDALKIIIQITKALLCLAEYDIYYTDLKLVNILYSCTDDNKVRIFIGDLGSANTFQVNLYSTGFATKYITPLNEMLRQTFDERHEDRRSLADMYHEPNMAKLKEKILNLHNRIRDQSISSTKFTSDLNKTLQNEKAISTYTGNTNISTYPFRKKSPQGRVLNPTEKDVVWGIGVMFLQFFNEPQVINELFQFGYPSHDYVLLSNVIKRRSIPQLQFLLQRIFNENEFERIGLKELLDEFSLVLQEIDK